MWGKLGQKGSWSAKKTEGSIEHLVYRLDGHFISSTPDGSFDPWTGGHRPTPLSPEAVNTRKNNGKKVPGNVPILASDKDWYRRVYYSE